MVKMRKKYWPAIIATLLIMIGGGAYVWWGQLVHRASTSVIVTPNNPIAISPEKQQDRINFLLLGSDTRGNEAGRTDSMIFISADVKTQHVSVISIPRDTRVNLPGIGLTKITHANAVGEANGGVHAGTMAANQAVSNLLGVTINDYIKINFQGFQKVVDSLGGLDLTLPDAVNDTVQDIHLKAGEQHLNGDMALRLARARFGLSDGDFGRQRDQFFILAALGHQALSINNISRLPQIMGIVHQDLMDTNLSDTQMVALGAKFKGVPKENIHYYQLPGKPNNAHDPLVGANVDYFEPDMAGVAKVVQKAMQN